MTVGLSNANLANKWLDMLGGTAFTAPSTAYAQLHTADPGASGTTGVSVGSTTRNSITWGSAAAGAKAMSSMGGTWTNGGTSETISHISVFDASTSGNFLFSVALTASKAWASGDTFSLTSLSISFTPIAA